ncbi:MAG: MFS transporter [Alphaproteobacteria bacterium GM202ARS2]|nr:MFS transporter [Alphaproteobacteria bacterium GM202ARS2]
MPTPIMPTPPSSPPQETPSHHHERGALALLKHRRFLPLFVTQFLGAFNDNLLKSGFTFLVIYRWHEQAPIAPEILVNLAAALLITPFLLFSAYAGRLADSTDKATLARIIKTAEIVIMALAIFAFHTRDTYFMLLVIFLMGSQSTFFGPIKYALLPLHLRKDELLSGNAFIESSTFMAILLGTLSGGLLALLPQASMVLAYTVMLCALCGFLASLYIPPAPPPPQTSPHQSPQKSQAIVRIIKNMPPLWTRILFISWFWFFGALLLAQLPAFVKNHLLLSQESATVLLLMLTLGITVGSFLCRFFLTLTTPYRIITTSALIMGVSFFLVTLAPILGFRSLILSSCLVFISATCGGLYSVPLYTQLQRLCPPPLLSRCIAVNNIVNATLIIVSAVLAIAILHNGGGVDTIFLMNACVPLLVGLYLLSKGKHAIP